MSDETYEQSIGLTLDKAYYMGFVEGKKAGAEAMRERAAKALDDYVDAFYGACEYDSAFKAGVEEAANIIRALPVEE